MVLKLTICKVWFHHRRLKEQAVANLEKSTAAEAIPAMQEGPQMILAGQLNDLLEIFPPAQILFVDLRSPSEFQRSHIHSAVNLRVPSKFLGVASLDMLDRAFPDEQSRRSFTRWSKAKCMVIYDRTIESPWECPTAPELLGLLRREGWTGRCFVLKGPFREFSLSFDKYITGDRMTEDSKTYTDSLRSATPPSEDRLRQNQARYEKWLRGLQHEGSTSMGTLLPNYSKPRDVSTKKAAVDEHQRELEAEFRGRCPQLYRRMKNATADTDAAHHAAHQRATPPALPLKNAAATHYHDNNNEDDSYFDTRKAHLVDSFSSGLDKLRDAAASSPTDTASSAAAAAGYSFPGERPQLPDKLGELPNMDYEDFDEIDPREALSPYYGGGGRSAASTSGVGGAGGGDIAGGSALVATPLDYAARRVARDALGRQGLWKRLRSNNGK